MKKVVTATVAGILMAGISMAGEGHDGHTKKTEEAEIKTQTTCPVMGGKTNANLYVDHEGKRVYVCCKGCLAPLKKNPEKYINKLESQGVTVTKIQTTCPVMGGKINKDLYADHEGQRIYVCCKGCLAPLQKDPEKYIEKLKEDGVTPDRVPQEDGGKRGEQSMPSGHAGHHH